MIEIVLLVLAASSFVIAITLNFALKKESVQRISDHEDNVDRIVHMSSVISELSEKVDGLEDYMKMIRSETENDKHADYWASVMNYNPYLEKEGEK